MAGFGDDGINHHFVLLVLFHLAELNAYSFSLRARDMFADVIRLHGYLAMAAVDQHGGREARQSSRIGSPTMDGTLLQGPAGLWIGASPAPS